MTVQLIKQGDSYIARTSNWKDGNVVKAAGNFRYDGAGGWITRDLRAAKLLAEFAAPELREELERAELPAAEPKQLLTLERRGDTFLAIGSYDANPVIRAAGFTRWDPDTRAWTTRDLEVAAKLAQFAAPALREELEHAAAVRNAAAAVAIEGSRATDVAIEIPAPAGQAYLPFQSAGIAYALRQFALPGITGVLIGDDMGLGKTVQAIGIVNAREDIRRVLIICPASLKLNWALEWNKWTTRGMTVALATPDHLPSTDAVILNYDIVHRLRDQIDAVAWDLLIADEAHIMKEKKAQRTAAILGGNLLPTAEEVAEGKKRGFKKAQIKGREVKPIQARLRAFLTGTPILNRPIEMWNLVQACDPQGMGADFWNFAKRYCNAYKGDYGWIMTGASNLDELQTKLRARMMVRRLKADVLSELPAKRRQLIEIAVNGAADVVAAERTAIERRQEAVARAESAMILAEANGDKSAYLKAVAALREARSFDFAEISKLRHATAVKKIPYCIEHIASAVESSGKVIVFAHHADVIAAIKKEFGNAAVAVTGQTKIADRQDAVLAFQNDPSVTVFIGNILAAGVGLTLTASAHVIFCELDWRPGIVTQAEDRAHRIGQENSVLVQHLVFEESLDATMAKMIVDKQEVIDKALDVDGAKLPTETDTSEINALIAGIQSAADTDEDRAARVAAAAAAAAAEPVRGQRHGQTEATPRWKQAEEERERRWAALDGEAALMTQAQIEATHKGLQLLAEVDTDRASKANGIGFNKGDSYAGNDLARRPELTPRQAAAARKMLRKYHGQIGEALVAEMG
jgi:SWI/SNF-related matrix-associated actin-dependent regulator 1 of chromatin subfamily A